MTLSVSLIDLAFRMRCYLNGEQCELAASHDNFFGRSFREARAVKTVIQLSGGKRPLSKRIRLAIRRLWRFAIQA